MGAMVKAPPSYKDLLSLPPQVMGQIVGGELVVCPRPPRRHAIVSSLLSGELCEPFDRGRNGPGGWWILDEPEVLLGEDVLVPDLAGWKRTRMEDFPRRFPVPLAPDWVGEVLWPGTASLDRIRKLPLYARAGVGHVWLIDPVERALEVFRLEGGRWILMSGYAGEATGRVEPFEAIELPLAPIWLSAEH